MLAKDSVKSRLETGLSFTEFSYQLIQGYDFFHLYTTKGVKLQMGGSDQWGNIVTGTELLRRKKGVNDAFAITTPLIKKADGTKFGKTESGNVWLDPAKTSPYKFYQFWINSSDTDASNYIRIFTLLSKSEIEAIEQAHFKAPHLRILQKKLAENITTRVHGSEALNSAINATELLFGQATNQLLNELDEKTLLEIFDGVPLFTIQPDLIKNGVNVVDLLAEHTQVFASKGECRKLIQGGGLSINKVKISDAQLSISSDMLLGGKHLLIQKGKKNYYLISLV
jgi:tyrosyl-tRNA synthetase